MGERLVALLRGINVGRKRRLPMAELRTLAVELGLQDPSTYLQSGNLLLASTGARDEVAAALERGLADRFGLHDVDVLLRSGEELARIVTSDPYLAEGAEEAHLAVAYLGGRPAAPVEELLDARAVTPERFRVTPTGDVAVHCPDGFHRAKLTNATIERRLGVRSTLRNWRTTVALQERLMSG
jgi:uncharacterized protein (DUF1697 family)